MQIKIRQLICDIESIFRIEFSGSLESESGSRLRSLGFFAGVDFFKLRTPEELNAIEEIGRIKGCSNVFEVISKYPKKYKGVSVERLFSSL